MLLNPDLETRIVVPGAIPANFRAASFDELKQGMNAYYHTFETYLKGESMRREEILVLGTIQEYGWDGLRSDNVHFKFLAQVRNDAKVPGTVAIRQGDLKKAWYLNGNLYVRK